jgi:glycosyltransferase involved in cell wall biosynthesis
MGAERFQKAPLSSPSLNANGTLSISIVVPAYNEEQYIGGQIASVRRFTPAGVTIEAIVVDNHSTDRTVAIAKEAGADKVLSVHGTVAAMRNEGARHARAEVLIFMDADVYPTAEWCTRIAEVAGAVRDEPMLLTGSWVGVPDSPSWIEKHWFKALENGQNSHINSGHMIISKTLFDRLGGFDEGLQTGEDFDLSMRAMQAGARIHDDPALRVVHHGFPKTIRTFARRELWHGVGDCRSLRTLAMSKVAMTGVLLLHLQIFGLIASLVSGNWSFLLVSLLFAGAVALLASTIRYRRASLTSRLVNTYLYYVYFWSRGLSLYAGHIGKRTRA